MKYDYAKARLTLDVLNQALSLLDSGLTMRALKAEFLHAQLVANFPEGGTTVVIFNRLNVCRSKKTFREAVDAIITAYIAPVMKRQERRLAEIRAYDEERARLTVDQAHEEALEMSKVREASRPAAAPAMPIAQMPMAPSTDAAIYLSGALQVGDRIEVRYAVGTVEELRRVYVLVSLPVRVANTCYQTFFAKQTCDNRVHRIAFNATRDGWELYERAEAK